MLTPRQRLVALGIIVVSASSISLAFLINGETVPLVLALLVMFGWLTIAMAVWRDRN
jgi:hypothetical protein